MRRRWFLVGAAALGGWLLLGRRRRRGARDLLDVLEIRASHGGGGIARALALLAHRLRRPPFSAFDGFELLARHEEPVGGGGWTAIELTTGGTLRLRYLHPRLRVKLVDRAGRDVVRTSVAIDSCDYWLIAGQRLDDGDTYVLAISCTVR